MKTPSAPRRKIQARASLESGFTLVEVLVSVVVLSLGVLGAVGMQAAAMQSNREARYQAAAGSLGRELAERMRGNHAVAVKTATADNPYLLNVSGSSAPTAPADNCVAVPCTSGIQMARWDVYEWRLRIRELVPSPRGVVCMDSDPFDSSGLPKWACDGNGTVAVMKLSWDRADAQGRTEFSSDATKPPLLVLPLTAGSSE